MTGMLHVIAPSGTKKGGSRNRRPIRPTPEVAAENAKRSDWISREGKPDRTIVRNGYRRKCDYELSPTDPD